MYKIVIIDDEQIVREGIRDLVDWKALGLKFVGDAEDGEKGYALIQQEDPDIILLDINMPRINGLDLTRMIRKSYSQAKIILITGYGEFSYAREALRLGVEDYILKPVTKAEITELLRTLVAKLKQEEKEKEKQIMMENQVEKSLSLLRQELLGQMIYGDIDAKMAFKKAQKLEIPTNKKKYSIALLDPDKNEKFTNDKNLLNFALDNIIDEWLRIEDVGILFQTEEMQHAILYYHDIGDMRAQKIYLDYLQDLRETIEKHLKITISIGTGKLVDNWDYLNDCYYEAKEALGQRFFLGNNSLVIIGGEEVTPRTIRQPSGFIDIEEEFLQKVQTGESEKVEELIGEIASMMKQQKLSIGSCQNIWIQLTTLMLKKFVQIDREIVKVYNKDIDIAAEINKCKTLGEVQDWMINLYKKCYDFIQERSSPNKLYMIDILSYIEQNYHQKDLSMKTVCSHVHLSVSYFSAIFKKEAGKTFIQYLTEFRLEKAKKLLKTSPLKTYEIADQVGYADPHYFSSLFRKQYGMTPSKYRKTSKE